MNQSTLKLRLTRRLSLVLISLFCVATATQAMDSRRRQIPLHAAYRLVTQKLATFQVDQDIKKTVNQEARAVMLQRAKNNRIAQVTAESIINDALGRFGLIVQQAPTKQNNILRQAQDEREDRELARAMQLSVQLAEQQAQKRAQEKQSLELARRLPQALRQAPDYAKATTDTQDDRKKKDEEFARREQAKIDRERQSLKLARRLQEEDQRLKHEQEARDLEFARRLQQQQEPVQGKLSNTPRPRTPSTQRQLSEYRRRQQQRNQNRTSTTTRTTQPTRSSSSSSIQGGIFRPHPKSRPIIQQPKYANFNHSFGTQLRLPGIMDSLRNCSAVYHVFSNALIPKQRGWACAFHVLYNACKIEEVFLGKKINNQLFINSCKLTASKIGESGNNLEVYSIAEQLKLSALNYLTTMDNTIVTLTRSGRFYHNGDELSALKQITNNMWQTCKNVLDRNDAQCIHFVGSIKSHNVPHAVLLSVIKQQDGSKALYIFDNMNGEEDRNAQEQIRRFAQHIYDQLMR